MKLNTRYNVERRNYTTKTSVLDGTEKGVTVVSEVKGREAIREHPDFEVSKEVAKQHDASAACSVIKACELYTDVVSEIGKSQSATCGGAGADNTDAKHVEEKGTIACNMLKVSLDVAVESVSVYTPLAVCPALTVGYITCEGKREKKVHKGTESIGCIAGTAGHGCTGQVSGKCRQVSGTKASVHDTHQNKDSERDMTCHAETDESSVNLDTTLSYALLSLGQLSTNVEITVKTKDGATSTNILCGMNADEDVSSVVSDLGKAHGVGSDAPVEELVKNVVSHSYLYALRMLYAGVLMAEVQKCTGQETANTTLEKPGSRLRHRRTPWAG